VAFSVPAKRMRVELFDNEGNRYSVSIEGEVTREKALRILDLVELLGGMPAGSSKAEPSRTVTTRELSKFTKVFTVLQSHFPLVWFSSREVQYIYDQELREPISLSTVATYIARLSAKGLVMKTGRANKLKYKLTPSFAEATVNQSGT
jgi:hypothetical protein